MNNKFKKTTKFILSLVTAGIFSSIVTSLPAPISAEDTIIFRGNEPISGHRGEIENYYRDFPIYADDYKTINNNGKDAYMRITPNTTWPYNNNKNKISIHEMNPPGNDRKYILAVFNNSEKTLDTNRRYYYDLTPKTDESNGSTYYEVDDINFPEGPAGYSMHIYNLSSSVKPWQITKEEFVGKIHNGQYFGLTDKDYNNDRSDETEQKMINIDKIYDGDGKQLFGKSPSGLENLPCTAVLQKFYVTGQYQINLIPWDDNITPALPYVKEGDTTQLDVDAPLIAVIFSEDDIVTDEATGVSGPELDKTTFPATMSNQFSETHRVACPYIPFFINENSQLNNRNKEYNVHIYKGSVNSENFLIKFKINPADLDKV